MRWREFGPSFPGQRPILYCRKVEILHFHYKSINYIEQQIQSGSVCLEIIKYIKLRSSFLSVRANSTVEGDQSLFSLLRFSFQNYYASNLEKIISKFLLYKCISRKLCSSRIKTILSYQ